MKITCLLNFLSFVFVIACNFEFSDIPYFDGIIRNTYHNSLAFLMLLCKGRPYCFLWGNKRSGCKIRSGVCFSVRRRRQTPRSFQSYYGHEWCSGYRLYLSKSYLYPLTLWRLVTLYTEDGEMLRQSFMALGIGDRLKIMQPGQHPTL